MSAAWVGPAAAAAGLLVVAGAAKLVRPGGTARGLEAGGLPIGPRTVRLGAAAETALGLWALGAGGPVAHLLVGSSYLAFGAFVVSAMAGRTPVSSCGCFGEPDVPPTATHVAVDLGAAAGALGAAAADAAPLPAALGDQPLGGVPLVALVVLAVALGAAVLVLLPRLAALRPGGAER